MPRSRLLMRQCEYQSRVSSARPLSVLIGRGAAILTRVLPLAGFRCWSDITTLRDRRTTTNRAACLSTGAKAHEWYGSVEPVFWGDAIIILILPGNSILAQHDEVCQYVYSIHECFLAERSSPPGTDLAHLPGGSFRVFQPIIHSAPPFGSCTLLLRVRLPAPRTLLWQVRFDPGHCLRW
jgi:hypothetical protein